MARARGPGEPEIGFHHVLCREGGRNDVEDALRALERADQNLLVIHGALDDFDLGTYLRGEFGRVSRDDPHGGVGSPEEFLSTCEPILPVGVVRVQSSCKLYRTVYIATLTLTIAVRGEKLSEHILWIAKNVFLEVGFERASMDVIASRAKTSKRTLYAHFENKEKLYLAVIDLVRGLVVSKLKRPGDYPGDATEALVMFCGRFLEILLYARTIQMCRLSIAEAARFPQGSALYFDVVLSIPHERLAAYLNTNFGWSEEISAREAQHSAGPNHPPAIFAGLVWLETLSEQLDDEAIRAAIRADFDLGPIRQTVTEWKASMEGRHSASGCSA